MYTPTKFQFNRVIGTEVISNYTSFTTIKKSLYQLKLQVFQLIFTFTLYVDQRG